MRHDANDRLEPGQPALLVIYGSTARKHRLLDRDALILGRAPNCDLCLVSPDISWVHCLLAHTPAGWRLRDCSGRGATRLNGKTVLDALLTNGDILQVGSFSFQLSLPSEAAVAEAPGDAAAREIERLQRSRHRLAQQALRLRGRLREQAAQIQESLQQHVETIQQRQREPDRRLRVLEQAERDLAADREALDTDYAAFEQRIEQGEAELREQRERLDAEWRDKWEELEREWQAAHRDADALTARAEQLEQRAQELDQLAEQLHGGDREGPPTGATLADLGDEPMQSLVHLREELRSVGRLLETLLGQRAPGEETVEVSRGVACGVATSPLR